MIGTAERIGYAAAGCAAQAARQFKQATATARTSLDDAEAEGRKTVAELQERLAKTTKRIEDTVHAAVNKEVKRLGLTTRKDLAALQERLERLETLLARPT